jgi:hypothetical protein
MEGIAMARHMTLSAMAALAFVAVATAQSPAPRFLWKADLTLDYKVEQTTTVNDTDKNKTDTFVTKLNLTKRWQVTEMDSAGVATLQLSLLAVRMETRKPNGQTDVFDSQNLDKANADLNKDMLQYIGQPIAVLRFDGLGRLMEVKKSIFGPASRFQSDLPFRIALPLASPTVGQTWDRSYLIKLEPPQGAGETYGAIQKYTCKSITADTLTVGLTTMVKELPDASADRIPLVPFQPEGTITFDVTNGRMKKAELKMDAEFADHRGDGSKYRYNSVYTEELVQR